MNPFLPFNYCVPDCEGRVFNNRIYIYGSFDIVGEMDYCSKELHTFSASIYDLDAWTYEGEIFNTKMVPWSDGKLYAPDLIEKNGRYYLYFCLSDGSEGVAVGDSPKGPFENVKRLFYPESIRNGEPLSNIDPAVFIDDDGRVYYYWGQKTLQGAELKENMCELNAESYKENIIDEKSYGFHEGASVRKIKGRYYLLFCSIIGGKATRLDYAVSDSPLGKFKYMGTVIDNIDCDPSSWNNHGSICEIKGEYYVFYHRASNNSQFSRRVCCERLKINEKGEISKAQMTSSGFGEYLKENEKIPFITGVKRKGECYFTFEDNKFILKNIQNDDSVSFNNFSFKKDIKCLIINAKVNENVTIEIYGDNAFIKKFQFNKTDDFIEQEESINVDKSIKEITFKFKGKKNKELIKLEWFILK